MPQYTWFHGTDDAEEIYIAPITDIYTIFKEVFSGFFSA